MEFDKRKAAALAAINSPEPDKSPKGTLDAPIIPLLSAINSHPSYFTTSSCSGRISVLSQPIVNNNSKKKAKGGTWLFISHDPVDPSSLLPLLFPLSAESSTPVAAESTQLQSLVFRFEPLIIAVECRDMEAAQSLVSLAISCGFRESGITSVSKRVIIAIRCSIRLEVPLGDTQRIMASPEYVEYLVGVANGKMESNRKRTDILLDSLLKSGFSRQGVSVNADVKNSGGEMSIQVKKREHFENSLEAGIESGIKDFDDGVSGSREVSQVKFSIDKMDFVGEPVERLFLWGHSACVLDQQKILVFGGFGGIGRHTRRNGLLLLDPLHGTMEALRVEGAPSPRLGHTTSIVGDFVYLVGGRTDPVTILNDVWIFDNIKKQWRLLQCSGPFPPRHRHAAAVVGSKIYIFGGINNEVILSSLYALDLHTLEWTEIKAQGEWPCPRHSHSMEANGSYLYVFGGYSGEKALGDLYRFDTETCLWNKVKAVGKKPHARFSHSMFIYNNYLGIIGGCPVSQDPELSLLDLSTHLWEHTMVNSTGECFFVRSTFSVIGHNLIIIGGGASCYAFGTKFSEPMKMNLLQLSSLHASFVPVEIGDNVLREEATQDENIDFSCCTIEQKPDRYLNINVELEEIVTATPWVLRLSRKHAKQGKDILKGFGWLDLERKVYSLEDGMHICFPVTGKFVSVLKDKEGSSDAFDVVTDSLPKACGLDSLSKANISSSRAVDLLLACGATKLIDKVARVKRRPNSPLEVMREAVASLLICRNLPSELLEQLPSRWERLGDIVVLPVTAFKDPVWESIGEELWPIVAKSLGTYRLARQGRVAQTGTRDSNLEILVGGNGWVDHRENGILYSFDATKCMFSWGNISEKLRMACLDCRDEIVVDLFAGIGYFVLPFLVRANAKMVYACEWNPHAIEALRRNLYSNSVADRCIVVAGDNRITAPRGVANRVCLGLLPSSEGSWVTAVRALRVEGGMLHIHGNVKDSEEDLWANHVVQSISDLSTSEGRSWEVSIEHVERVKWYAPHIRHLVVDIRCQQIQS